MKPTKIRRPDLMAELPQGIPGAGFIGPEILPPWMAPRKADTFGKPVFDDKALTIVAATLARAPKGDYQRLNYRTTSDSYSCQDEGLEDAVDDVQEADVSREFDAEADCARGVLGNLRRSMETAYGAYIFDASTLFSDYTGDVSTEWSTAATATPYNDVQDALTTILARIGGVLPAGVERCLACSSKVFRNMSSTADILRRRAGGTTNAKNSPQLAMSEADMASVLGLDGVFQGNAKNASTDIWDDEYALVFLRATGRDLAVPALGRTFAWEEDAPGSPFIVETYREEPRNTVVLVRSNVQRYAFNAQCGQLLGNITA